MMKKAIFGPLILTTALSFSACSKKAETPKPLSQSNPIIHGSIDKNFSKKFKGQAIKSYHITMTEEALKQNFLMTVAEIEGAPSPTGSAFANKLVNFIVKDGSVYMFESLDGKLNSTSIETKALLAEFPIVKQEKGSVTFDFKNGMKQIFYKRSMYSSDTGPAPKDIVINITHNYIDQVELRGNYLYINQFVRYESLNAQGVMENTSSQLKYTLSTYKKNENFKPRSSNLQEKVGYFEVHPTIEAPSGKKTINVVKFDITKPVTYSLSRNIPEEYLQAVKDGVLYWNRVFGKEVIKLDTLPKGISVHEPGYNIVQWLDWDTAGFAYANMQADPLTGETIQSHVYMTSVFGKGGYARAKRIYRQLLAQKETTKKSSLSLKGFKEAEHCHFDYKDSMVSDLGQIFQLIEKDSSESKDEEKEKIFKRYAQDYVRQVVAHEVGHTLGLRHNFAGSLTTTITPKVYNTVSKVYFLTGNLLPGMIPTSTVMDYTPSMISSMLGAHIRLNREALSYDKQAINFGYSKDEVKVDNFDAFCTDSHKAKGVYQDCKIWDNFSNPVDAAMDDWKVSVKGRAFALASKFDFLTTKTTDPERTLKISKIRLTPRKDAESLFKLGYSSLVDIFSPAAEFINIRREFPKSMNMFEEEDYAHKVLDFKVAEAAKIGGLSNVLLKMGLMADAESKEVAVSKQIKDLFNTYMKRLYSDASEQEMTLIEEKTDAYFAAFEKEVLLQMTKLLTGKTFAVKDKNFANVLSELATPVLFEKGDDLIGQVEANGTSVFRPKFDYVNGVNLRDSMINLLNQNFFPQSPSYTRKMSKLKEDIKAKHTAEMERYTENTTLDDLADDLYDWLYYEEARFSQLR